MSGRKQQILQAAINIIVDQGYASLSMRALARASGMKLGALQYHFRTSDEMLRGLVAYIADIYQCKFESMTSDSPLTISDVLEFASSEPADGELRSDKLWPQLWAMGQVHPLVAELVDDIYEKYCLILVDLLKQAGSKSPRAEAIALMSFVEGSTIFIAAGRPWETDESDVRRVVNDLIKQKYGSGA
jgi:AcrR family transcriptional regulator